MFSLWTEIQPNRESKKTLKENSLWSGDISSSELSSGLKDKRVYCVLAAV